MKPAPTSVAGGPARRRIGKYVLTGRIGKGGMGRVYRGFDEALEREVAVKTLSYEGSQDDDHRKRFAIEAKAAARLQHPNIVTIYEWGEDRGVPFIAMELLPGVDLETLLRAGEPLLLTEALEVMVQACRGLQFAHDRGIVHRDVKPSNIRVLDDGAVKIMDFGIAKLGATGITKTGMMVGTVHYMSPEQVRGQPLDGRSDVFSLGVILYELLARRRPFSGEGATDILYKIVHDDPEPLPEEELGPAGQALRGAVLRALAKDQDQRWPGAGALGDELARLLAAQRPALLAPVDATERVKQARALVSEDKLEEGLGRLKELTAQHPQLLEARRALRWATREAQRRQAPAAPEEDHFPELDATFQSPATEGAGAVTDPGETRADPPPTVLAMRTALTRLLPLPAAVSGRPVLAVGGVALVLALGVGLYFLAGGEEPSPAGPSAANTPRPVPRPSASASAAVSPAVNAEAGRATAQPAGPQGKVSVTSPYAVDVQWKDRVLARGETAAQVSLPAGRQTLTLSAPQYLLRQTVTVEVKPDAVAEVVAPELGRINVRANPDNCKVFIDGVFIDYPPILDRPLAAGTHSVSFKWPDGQARDEEVVVERGKPAYVTGRRE
jgi:serine/threonine protein kinase